MKFNTNSFRVRTVVCDDKECDTDNRVAATNSFNLWCHIRNELDDNLHFIVKNRVMGILDEIQY